MRIGIDVRYLSHGLIGGVHSYVANFVPELIDLAADHQVYLYADTKRPFELSNLPGHVTTRFLSYRNPLSSALNDYAMGRAMARDRLDVVHFPANYGFGPPNARVVITLHDAINVLPLREILRGHRKDARTIAMMIYLHVLTGRAARRADLLLTTSTHARHDIARHARFDLDRIVAVPNAPAPSFRRITDPEVLADTRHRHGLGSPFILADALKNPETLLRAWELLSPERRAGAEIVFFSRRPDPHRAVRQAVALGQARLLVRPSAEDLMALYSLARGFVFPSRFEGFGIPLIEAMICGAPVIASNRGGIPEVVGDAALLAEADDAGGLAEHLARVLGDPEVGARLQSDGFARAGEYSWRNTARRILSCYETIAATPAPARAAPGGIVGARGPEVAS